MENEKTHYTEQGLPKNKKPRKAIRFKRVGIRFKIALGTFFFLITFLIFFLLFSNQYSQKILSSTYSDQATNIFNSLKSEYQDYLSGQYNHNFLIKTNKLFYKKIQLTSSSYQKNYYRKFIKQNIKKMKDNDKKWQENYKRMKEKMISLSKQHLTTYHTQFSLSNYRALFHSNIYNTPSRFKFALLNSNIHGRNKILLNAKANANKPLRTIILNHKKPKITLEEKKV